MTITALRPPLYLPEVAPPGYCEQIIRLFENGKARPRSYQGLVDNRTRECNFVQLPPEGDHLFHKIITEHMEHYFNRTIDRNLRARPMVYGYPVGVGFVPHHDQVTEIELERSRTNGQPVIGGDYTVVLFCARLEDYAGGDLYFPEHGWSFRPPAGSAVIYPSTEEYIHGVKPITQGVRYTVVCRMFNAPRR